MVVAYWAGVFLLKRLAPNAKMHRVVALLIGLLILVLLISIPLLGGVIWLLISMIGSGAVLLAFVGRRLPLERDARRRRLSRWWREGNAGASEKRGRSCHAPRAGAWQRGEMRGRVEEEGEELPRTEGRCMATG